MAYVVRNRYTSTTIKTGRTTKKAMVTPPIARASPLFSFTSSSYPERGLPPAGERGCMGPTLLREGGRVRRSKHPVLDQVGRALLGGIFIRSGWDVVREPGARPE